MGSSFLFVCFLKLSKGSTAPGAEKENGTPT